MRTLARCLAEARDGGAWFVDEDGDAPFVGWPELAADAARAAGGLRAAGVRPGDAVGLVVPDGRRFLRALFATHLAGAVPVPMFPPLGLAGLDAWREGAAHALRATDARVLLAAGEVLAVAPVLHHDLPELRAVLSVDALDGPPTHADDRPDRPALLQLTSGSTGRPQPIAVAPAALDANISAFLAGIGGTSRDICASWLPLYHDMGLVGHALGTLWADGRVALLHPLAFLKRPERWLQLVSRFRATVSFAPNFAYGLAERRVREDVLADLDLSCWRVAGCGAEPVDPTTLRRFAARFAPTGFREEAFLPCYGLAEHTLAVSFPRPGRGLVVVRGVVGCGSPFPGHALRIVGPDGRALPDGEVGEIELDGPSVAVPRPLRTGDLGFLDDGEVFVCGRIKDLIVIRGRNHHPHDLERLAQRVEEVRRGGAVAFAVPGPEGERAVLLVESRSTDPTLPERVHRVVAEATGLQAEVVVVPPRTLPRTSSGKPRRREARDRWLEGRLLAGEGHGPAWHLAAAGLGRARAAVRAWWRPDGPETAR